MESKFFSVIGVDTEVFDFNTIHETLHFNGERKERHIKIVSKLGDGKQLYSFVVDKAHPNGDEIHTIFSNGVIVIRNKRTNLLITELIARPGQLRRYWENLGKALPIEIYPIIRLAENNQKRNYNYW